MKIATITSIFGEIDHYNEIPNQTINSDVFLFNENNNISEFKTENSRLQSKYYKIQSHKIKELKKYDWYLYIDGSLNVLSNKLIELMINNICDEKIIIQKHIQYNCIYKITQDIINIMEDNNSIFCDYYKKRYEKNKLKEEIEEYRKNNHPSNIGLWHGGLFLRKNDEETNNFFDLWWNQINKFTLKDQNSLAFLINKTGIKIKTIECIMDDNIIQRKQHIK